jgi:ATP-dependent helicase/nuclease subunit B
VVPVPPANVQRFFLPWRSPLLPQAVAWLARDWTGAGPLDLARGVVVVPTKHAGRRLRAGLAEHAAARGQAVFPPRVVSPEALLSLGGEGRGVATPLQTTLAWTQVLLAADLDEFRAVFPLDPPARSFAWALQLAQEMFRLQQTLAEGALTIGEVATRAPAALPERERWHQLAELARRQGAALARHGWREPHAAQIEAAFQPAPWEDVERIVLLGVPDPLPLALIALASQAGRTPVDVVVFAPEEEAAAFDGWGRPLTAAWKTRAAPWTEFSRQVHVRPDAAAQAEEVAQLAARYGEPEGRLGVGVADPEIAPLAANALLRAGCPAFDPAGAPRRQSGFFQLLVALAAFADEASFAHAAALARRPHILAWLRADAATFRAEDWLRGLDDLQAAHLPATLSDAQRHATGVVAFGLRKLAELRQRLRAGPFAPAVAAALAEIFPSPPHGSDAAREELIESASAWTELLAECDAAAAAFPQLTRADWWEIALSQFGAKRREAEKPAGALELLGWLELLWEDAPHVVVAGLNDGFVPKAILGDVFLPESRQRELGLKTNEDRLACDAYLLHALVAARREGGRVDVLVGKVSAAGDPLKPSRLLLLGADEELPARVDWLFRPLETNAVLPAWERAWQLRPPAAAVPTRVSVTAFRAYLECPFRFYLRHVLKMEAVDPDKTELDVFDFGRLCHTPLEKLKEAPWRDATDERVLSDMLLEVFDAEVRARFGERLAVPLLAQLESARQRLRRAAAVQARERAAGWVVQDVERDFRIEVGGLVVSGQIDRIDRHEQTGEWRVIDYKTSDAGKPPAETHLVAPRRGRQYPDWALVSWQGKGRAWADLQLPLYLHALPQLGLGDVGRPTCGYFNLPKATGDTGLALWDGYTPELQESALACVRGVVAAIRAEQFWPPNEEIRAERDAFAELFHRGVAASVAWPPSRAGEEAPR